MCDPGWPAFLALAAASAAGAWIFRVRRADAPRPPEAASESSAARVRLVRVLGAFVALGVVLFLLRALTEPMWSNDYIAIWGLKAKTIHAAGTVPSRLFEDPELGFSHPEYPLGLPLLYAGVAFLTGRYDDHAMALLFPLFQVATLFALFGWLRRHGATRVTAVWATAILACFEPLYSAFTTGLAEVPLSLGLLLFGTALADSLEGDPGALRRTALASALIAGTKNEGLFFAAAGCAIALLFGGKRRFKAAFASLPTALLVHGLHLAWRGQLPLRDFDFGTASIGRVGRRAGRGGAVAGADRVGAAAAPGRADRAGAAGPGGRLAARALRRGLRGLSAPAGLRGPRARLARADRAAPDLGRPRAARWPARSRYAGGRGAL